MQLFWHRRDLRVSDNRGLAAAADSTTDHGPIVPVFVFDPVVLDHASPPRVAFLLDALTDLRERYRDRGSDLLVVEGEPTGVLLDVVDAVAADRVHWNEDYSGLARERDEAARAAFEDSGVACVSHQDAVCHHPVSIRTNQGDPYSVFTYYWKKWRDHEKAEPAPVPNDASFVDSDALADALDPGEIPSLSALGFETPEADVPAAGTDVARGLLGNFCAEDIYQYDEAREYPARADAAGDREEAVEEFQSQLAWREFYTQVLYHHPEVVTENFNGYANPIEWRDDEAVLQAWKDGETGYPIVDHGERREEAIEMFERARGDA